jgi:hypothetical protein
MFFVRIADYPEQAMTERAYTQHVIRKTLLDSEIHIGGGEVVHFFNCFCMVTRLGKAKLHGGYSECFHFNFLNLDRNIEVPSPPC